MEITFKKILLIVLAVAVVILIGALAYPQLVKKNSNVDKPASPAEKAVEVKSGIEVTSPTSNGLISSPLKITGMVNGSGWNGFEGQVGMVTLYDFNGNKIAQGVLTATTEWTKLPVSFETALDFKMPKDSAGKLLFQNENPSGDPAKDMTFSLPVKFK